MAGMVSPSPCRNSKIWSTGSHPSVLRQPAISCFLNHILLIQMQITFINTWCVTANPEWNQDSLEALLLFWRWGVHCGWFSQAACAVHLGEEHWQPGQDSARHTRRAAPRRRCKDITLCSLNAAVYGKKTSNISQPYTAVLFDNFKCHTWSLGNYKLVL